MSEEPQTAAAQRRRRRRRRKKGSGGEGAAVEASGHRRQGRDPDLDGNPANIPSSGRNPSRKRSSRARRGPPGSPAGRKRKLAPSELQELTNWLERLPEALVGNLYRALGGQPGRAGANERMITLAVRAIAQGGRIGALVKGLQDRDRTALAALLQCGGLAHADEFHRELSLSFGGHERDWARAMGGLSERGIVLATREQDGLFFYVVPPPLLDGLLAELADEIQLRIFESPDVRVIEERPFCPPLDFSIATLATYIDQRSPRLTQRHEIHRHDQEVMDGFFAQIWDKDSDLFSFHLDFLLSHGMIELRGEHLLLTREVVEEWLQLEPEDQRDLLFRSLSLRFPLAEWVLWAMDQAGTGWIAERPLVSLYRRWRRGEDWRDRFRANRWTAARAGDRDGFSFAPLVRAGILELGQWGQEKFYRLSARGRHLLHPPADDGFHQFYLTPSFEIMAPAGLAPVLLFRIGELADLVGCDRANTYKITETSIERALKRGWRRDDVLQFLRDNSQIGLPDNVESTLKGWIGHRGDVEFHDLCLMTVHRSQIRRLEGSRRIKPYILHRFAPGMYAIDRSRREEVMAVLAESGFSPSKEVRGYPGKPEQVEARVQLQKLVAEAREATMDQATDVVLSLPPETLQAVPGTRIAQKANSGPDLPPKVTPAEVRALIDQAILKQRDLEMVYATKEGQRLPCIVEPHRIAFKGESPVLVGLDRGADERRTYVIDRIERVRIVEAR